MALSASQHYENGGGAEVDVSVIVLNIAVASKSFEC